MGYSLSYITAVGYLYNVRPNNDEIWVAYGCELSHLELGKFTQGMRARNVLGDRRKQFDLERLQTLPEGWLNGDGRKINRGAVALARDMLKTLGSNPHIYPMPCGGVCIEYDGPNGFSWAMEIPTGNPDHIEISCIRIKRE